MATYTAAFHYEVNQLIVSEELIGSRREISFDGRRCFIVIPQHNYDFDRPRPEDGMLHWPMQFWQIGAGYYCINTLRIEVQVENDITPADLEDVDPQGQTDIEGAENGVRRRCAYRF